MFLDRAGYNNHPVCKST